VLHVTARNRKRARLRLWVWKLGCTEIRCYADLPLSCRMVPLCTNSFNIKKILRSALSFFRRYKL